MKKVQGAGRLTRLVAIGIGIMVSASCGVLATARDSAQRAAAGDFKGAIKVATDRVVPGALSPQLGQLVETLGPHAIVAVNLVVAAIQRQAAEDRAEAERRRVQLAAAQIFYATECTQAGAAPAPGAAGTAGAADDAATLEANAAERYGKGDYAGAERLLEDARGRREKAQGKESAAAARTTNKLAVVKLAREDYSSAMALSLVALDAREKLAKARSDDPIAALDVAESLSTNAVIQRAVALYGEARGPAERSLGIRQKYLGATHLCVAQTKSALADLHEALGAYRDALPLRSAALAIRDQQLGPDHPDTARARNDLGLLYQAMGLYGQAQGLIEAARAARLKLGEDHPDVADSDTDLAGLYRAMGRLAEAERLYQRAIEIRTPRADQGLELAASLNDLAGLHVAMGDPARAEPLFRRALQLRRGKLPADHPAIAASLNDLGAVYLAVGDTAQAEKLYSEALEIRRKRFGKEHPAVADSLGSLASVDEAKRDYARAETRLVEARAIREKSFGVEHPQTAESLHRLGAMYLARGEPARAEPLLRQALDIRQRTLGPDHPDVAESLTYLATLLTGTGRTDEAVADFRRALGISEKLLRSIGGAASESQLASFLRHLRTEEDMVYSLLLEKQVPAAAAESLAMTVALLRKGRSVDELAATSRAVYQGLGNEGRQRFEELKAVRGEIAHLSLAGATGEAAEHLRKLRERADDLERKLGEQSAPLRARARLAEPDKIVAEVARRLPADGTLVEIVAYYPYLFHAAKGSAHWGERRYHALVLAPNGELHGADLGPAGTIDEEIQGFLRAITEPMGVERRRRAEALQAAATPTRQAAEALDRRIMAPIRGFLGNRTALFLSLDGQLNLLPFAALHDGTDYLLVRHELVYLTSGRDLLRDDAAAHASTTVAVIAKPEFLRGGKLEAPREGTRGFDVVEDATPMKAEAPAAAPVATISGVRLTAIDPLNGTGEEARAIQKLLPEAQVYLGKQSTKDVFLSLQAPGILHVATHGWFRPDRSRGAGGARGLELVMDADPAAGAVRRGAPEEAALVSSMLLLAGVGVPASGGRGFLLQADGVATALEVAGMNLWGTQLVVLSACETGRGDVNDLGQGVYGLRRAVMVAGAETLVTSLWKVDDEATRDLMTRYYALLLQGQGRVAAMRQASLAVRKDKPYVGYWAPFIAIGRNAPLSGIGGVGSDGKPGRAGHGGQRP
jgi:CHAT domain-containing protein/Tfp pilus assembly protein PilF